ncbi:cytochrome P450 family protein [Pseudonocardia sp. TRM90224]|uniref:cytochrome P450 family protein n=1 Tax=Pseudonocardia sp. TRM90224 TaxID=2812678 RepID=UPI001E598C25|nr:cytochrome P450 [Pseudonocardia sp. TRM90224]
MTVDGLNADPHATNAQLRAEGPVIKVVAPDGLEHWLITRYDVARAALADDRLAKDPRHGWAALEAAGRVSGRPEDMSRHLLTSDPPDHTRLRGLVSSTFTPRKVAGMKPKVQQIVTGILDGIAANGTADAIAEIALPISFSVIEDLLGVRVDDRAAFRTWTTAALTQVADAERTMSRQEGAERLGAYVERLVDARYDDAAADAPGAAPGDIVGGLITAQTDEGTLSRDEVVEMTRFLLFSGHETTTNLIGSALAALLTHPEQRALLRRRPDLMRSAVEEVLRFEGSTAQTSPRFALEDIELGGTTIPAGSIVVIALAAANRDPDAFPDPDRFDLTRSWTPHLAFGHGAHFCVGAPLARMETDIALRSILDRFPDIALVEPDRPLEWRPTHVFRGLERLPVTWSP